MKNNYNIINSCGNNNRTLIVILLLSKQFKLQDSSKEMIYILERLASIYRSSIKPSLKIAIHSNHQADNIVLIPTKVKRASKLNNSNNHNINQKLMFRALLEITNYS